MSLSGMFFTLIPGMTEHQKKAVWRVAVTCALMALFAFSTYAHNTFAKSKDITDLKVILVEDRMFSVRLSQCAAMREGNVALASALRERLVRLMREYRDLTGGNWDMPACEELV